MDMKKTYIKSIYDQPLFSFFTQVWLNINRKFVEKCKGKTNTAM